MVVGPPEIRAGDKIEVAQWPPSVTDSSATSQTDITSTTFTAGSPVVDVNFKTPASGCIGVAVSGRLVEQTPTNRVFLSFEVYEGTSASGTLVWAADDNRGVCSSGDGTAALATTSGNFSVVCLLTPGVDHYARTMHRVEVSAGSTNDITHRRIVVIPLP